MKAIIIDDEKPGRENLKAILISYFPYIDIIGMAASVKKARELVEKLMPDLIFLDIELGDENGLDFLNSFENPSFQTIFVTAYENYALKAFRTQATDYIIKPIDISELGDAIQKVKENIKLKQVSENIESANNTQMIKVSTFDGSELISSKDIIYFQAINFYTKIKLSNQREFVIAKTLKEFEYLLEKNYLLKVHRSYIINTLHIKSIHFSEPCYVCMNTDEKIPISRRRKLELEKISSM